jgi:predicted small secreted protein
MRDNRIILNVLAAISLACGVAVLTACNTMEGAGEDMEEAGEEIQEEADDNG